MKRIGVTQRVDFIEEYSEVRDCLDQRWCDFLDCLGVLCIPLPNLRQNLAAELLGSLGLDAVIFSGGNTLTHADPNAPDASLRRDQFESAVLKSCLDRAIPVLGVCRGMQFLNVALGGNLEQIEGHVATRHTIVHDSRLEFPEEVNSYHGWAVPPGGLAPEFTPLAFDSDGNVEAYEHKSVRLRGMMWHPERELKPHDCDLKFIEELLV